MNALHFSNDNHLTKELVFNKHLKLNFSDLKQRYRDCVSNYLKITENDTILITDEIYIFGQFYQIDMLVNDTDLESFSKFYRIQKIFIIEVNFSHFLNLINSNQFYLE